MVYGSVCSGIEAATVAWHSLGWEPAWFSEIEPFPCKVLKHHYPHVPNLGNMLHLNENKIFNEQTIDLLVGGTPCQDFSVAGLRAGLAGERGNLTLEFCRILVAKQPRWFVWENVPGALSSFSDATDGEGMDGTGPDNGRTFEETADFAEILTAFRECGYSCVYRILDAQHFGVPQRRRRIFVVGYFGDDWRPPAAVLFDGESLSGDTAKGRKKRTETTGTLDARIKGGGFPGSDEAMNGHVIPVIGPLTAMSKGRQPGINEAAAGHVISTLTGRPYADNEGKETNLIPFYFEPRIARNGRGGIDFVAAPLKAQSGKTGKGDGQGHVVTWPKSITGTLTATFSAKQGIDDQHIKQGAPFFVPVAYGGNNTSGAIDVSAALSKTHGRYDFESETFLVMNPVLWSIMPQNSGKDYKARQFDVTQPLMKCQRGPQSNQGGDVIQQGIRVRRLTPLECERLQGFPDNYTLIPGSSDTTRYQAMGNSMAVPVMHWIGKRIDIVDKYLKNGTK